MKKVLSTLLATIMIISCFASIPTTVQAANKQIKTIGISSESDLETKTANGYVGLTDTLTKITSYGEDPEKLYNFTINEDSYVFISVVSKGTTMNTSGNITTKLYSSDLTKQYYDKDFLGKPAAVGNTLTYLTKGTYTLYVRYTASYSGGTNLTVNIGTLSKDTKFLSATYMGAVTKPGQQNGQTIKLKINSLDKIEDILYYVIYETRNYDYQDLNSFGGVKKGRLDENGYLEIALRANSNPAAPSNTYSYVNIAIKDVYGITHAVEYQILNDYTATVEGITNKTYTGKPITQNKFTVYAGYKSSTAPTYKVSYKNNTNIGTAQITFTGTGNTLGSVTKTFKINPIGANSCSASLSATKYYYDGKVKTPNVSVKCNGKTLTRNKDYTVSYSSGRKYVGRYAVTINFKGNYSGKKVMYFYVIPKGTSINKITATKKGFKVYWKKQSSQTSGYQIQYATNSKFSKAKTVTVNKNSYTSKSVSKLSAKKRYYVRVRTYKTVKINGKNTNIYSGWSKAKAVTTKK